MRNSTRSGGRWWHGLTVAFAALAAGALAAPAEAATTAPVPATSYHFTSEAGDYIGQGGTATYRAPTDAVTMGGSAASLRVSVGGWDIELAAPAGETLHPGVYRDAERAAFRTGRSPGLDVGGNGRGCNEVYGQFSVNQIGTDDSGAVTLLDATFTQHCEQAGAPALRGTVKYRALPLSYAYTSDEGDWIGGGTKNTYTGSTSTFTLGGTAHGIGFGVSGKRDNWSVAMNAPVGEDLVVGRTYQANRMGSDGAARLDATGDGRGCNESSSEFTVTRLVTDDTGKVTGLAASFVQHCEGGVPALHGTIHYFA